MRKYRKYDWPKLIMDLPPTTEICIRNLLFLAKICHGQVRGFIPLI